MSGIKNKSMQNARNAKNDEFYTELTDIEKELKYYEHHFKGKHIFCNADDPEFSNFWRYFALNFHRLELKQLTSTHYSNDGPPSYRMDMYRNVPKEALDKETFITLEEVGIDLPLGYITPLKGDGDFRSDEAIEVLTSCDMVVTNPPFSLFREYVAQLMEFEKDFIIIGNMNAVTYKEIFPLIKENKMWLGVTRTGTGSMWFRVPDDAPNKKGQKVILGERYQTIGNSAWFTNLDHERRYEEIILYKSYNEIDYPTYDNYNAIEVSKVVNIPEDYDGIIGVPITFLGKYNPNQFEIIGSRRWGKSEELLKAYKGNIEPPENDMKTLINGKETYDRIFIKRKRV